MHFLSGPPSLGAVDMDYVYRQIEERAESQGSQIRATSPLAESKLLSEKRAQDERFQQFLRDNIRRAQEERRKRNLLIIGGLAAASALFFSMRG